MFNLLHQIECLEELEDSDFNCLKETDNEAKIAKWMKYRFEDLNRTPKKCKAPQQHNNTHTMTPTLLQYTTKKDELCDTTNSLQLSPSSFATTASAHVMQYRNNKVDCIHIQSQRPAVVISTPPCPVRPNQQRSCHATDATNQSSCFKKVQQEWDYDHPCQHCGYVYLSSIPPKLRTICCNKGKWLNCPRVIEPLKPYPAWLREMMIRDIVHFSKNSVIYNRQLSIGSTFIDNNRGNKVERINGAHSVKINGSVSYYIKKKVGRDFFNGINYFTFDGLQLDTINNINSTQSLSSASKFGPMIKYAYMKKIFQYMKTHNALCKELKMIGKTIVQQQNNTFIQSPADAHRATENLRALINGSTSFVEVAGFTADTLYTKRQITYELKGQKQYLSMQNPKTESIMYPLLFLHNESGWKPEYKKELSQYKYMCSRLLMPEKDWVVPNKKGDRLLQTNRFQVMSRLSQHMMVEIFCQAQDYKLNWHKRNNEAIRSGGGHQQTEVLANQGDAHEHGGTTMESVIDGLQPSSGNRNNNIDADNIHEDTERVVNSDSSPSFLADSFTGAPRHLKALSLNALAVVTELGQPTVFITLTVNPKWKEIEEQLLEGQTAFDRPDVVVQVFKQRRLSALIHNLKNGKYFGGRKTIYKIYVIEYQHRGLPHAHIVVKLKDVDDNDKDAKLLFIDEHIRARFPPEGEDIEYARLIEEHMIHTCSDADNGCLNDQGHCKRGYQLTEIRLKSIFDEKGYPIYARPCATDLRVVPHNREILLDWQGHANVEFCADSYAVLYLYKYLFKGNRKVTMQLDNVGDVHKKDEILLFQRGRMICAMQAMFVFFGYQQYPASDPSVILIKVKDPSQLLNITSSKQLCDMFVYFSRPRTEEVSQLTYKQFFQKWNYSRKNIHFQDGRRTIQLSLQHSSIRNVCLFERSSKSHYSTIIRLSMVPSTIGEMFWLRTLLNKYPAYNYSDLKTVHGFVYPTFQEAACALDFQEKKDLATATFKECLTISTAHELRMYS